MKIHTAKLVLFALGVVLAGAIGVSAFPTPSAAPTAGNTDAPINVSNVDQVKNGGLSVNTFHVRDNALFVQNAIFKGVVRGGLPTDATSTLKVGTDATVTGTLRAKQFLNAKVIAHTNDATEKPLCADDQGVIVTCETLVNTGGGNGGGAVVGPPTVIAADAQPTTNGGAMNNPDAVLCTATLDNPAEAAGATVDMNYSYQNDQGLTVMGVCQTITIPQGSKMGSSTNPEQFGGGMPLISSCVNNASIPVDPAIHC